MKRISIVGTGLIYKNPTPHLRSRHAYFPSVASLGGGEMVASLVLGEAFESTDLHTHIARSRDGGDTWEMEGEICPRIQGRLVSDTSRITALGNGGVAAFMIRADRSSHPEEGLANPETLGFVPTELCFLDSRDGGRTWSAPRRMTPEIVGPEFELCCPVVPLKDGRWIIPTSTWRRWDGWCPDGMRMVALVSRDRGNTWSEHLEVMDRSRDKIIFWESKIVELADGRMLAVAWAYDEKTGKDLPDHFAVSADGGARWTEPDSTGLAGQTLTPMVLPDGNVLTVYRRTDQPGLWANVSRIHGHSWVNENATPLWGAEIAGLTGGTSNAVRNFTVLRFGAPCITPLTDGTIFMAFWCYEEYVSVIRWFKLHYD